jgi:regulator of RNase E activity RraA
MQARNKGSAGKLPEDRIGPSPKRVSKAIVDRFLALNDLSSTISDVLDDRGIIGAFGSSHLPPTIPGSRIVGTAITVRNVPQRLDMNVAAKTKSNLMTEIEGIYQCDPGDVLVIQGLRHVSNMGGVMATTAHRQKLAGAIVDGGIRDVGQSRSLNFPIWSRDISPVTGKWRVVTEEVNGRVTINGIMVDAGDLVVADETGICFVPGDIVEDVLAECEAIHNTEGGWISGLDKGMSIPDLVKKIY